jgi:hypothetical protein
VIVTWLSVIFALNGLALSVIAYPHFEILIPALLLIAIYLLLERRLLAAAIVGVLALLIREDVGFHFLAIAGPLIVLNRIRGTRLSAQMHIIAFAGAGLLYSCASIGLQRYFFPAQDHFAWVYAGAPPFGHLTTEFAWARLMGFGELRVYVWLPLLMICLSAAILGNPYVLLGALAVLPWVLLQLIALNDVAGALEVHYVFPIIIAVGWAGIAIMWHAFPAVRSASYSLRLGLLAGIVLSTFVSNPKVWPFFHAAVPTEFALHPQKTRQFVDALRASLPTIRTLRADSGTISLRPDMFTPAAWLVPQDWTGDRQPSADVNVLVFFNGGFEQEKALVQLGAMTNPRLHSIPGTNVLMAVAANVDLAAPVARLLGPAPNSLHPIPYFFAGFYDPGARLRWAKTRSPSVYVWNCAARTLMMDMIGYAVWPKVAAEGSQLQVQVLVNGVPYSTLSFTSASQQRTLAVPIKCIDGTMTVGFSYDYLIIPSQNTVSLDTRPLGIGIVGDPRFD